MGHYTVLDRQCNATERSKKRKRNERRLMRVVRKRTFLFKSYSSASRVVSILLIGLISITSLRAPLSYSMPYPLEGSESFSDLSFGTEDTQITRVGDDKDNINLLLEFMQRGEGNPASNGSRKVHFHSTEITNLLESSLDETQGENSERFEQIVRILELKGKKEVLLVPSSESESEKLSKLSVRLQERGFNVIFVEMDREFYRRIKNYNWVRRGGEVIRDNFRAVMEPPQKEHIYLGAAVVHTAHIGLGVGAGLSIIFGGNLGWGAALGLVLFRVMTMTLPQAIWLRAIDNMVSHRDWRFAGEKEARRNPAIEHVLRTMINMSMFLVFSQIRGDSGDARAPFSFEGGELALVKEGWVEALRNSAVFGFGSSLAANIRNRKLNRIDSAWMNYNGIALTAILFGMDSFGLDVKEFKFGVLPPMNVPNLAALAIYIFLASVTWFDVTRKRIIDPITERQKDWDLAHLKKLVIPESWKDWLASFIPGGRQNVEDFYQRVLEGMTVDKERRVFDRRIADANDLRYEYNIRSGKITFLDAEEMIGRTYTLDGKEYLFDRGILKDGPRFHVRKPQADAPPIGLKGLFQNPMSIRAIDPCGRLFL